MFPVTPLQGQNGSRVFGLGPLGPRRARRAGGGRRRGRWPGTMAPAPAPPRPPPASRSAISPPPIWREFAALVLSPGVPLTHPAPHLDASRKARAAGIEMIGDIELFCRENAGTGRALRRHHRHQRQIDHDGAHRPCAARGRAATPQVGGNIGTAVLALRAAGARPASMSSSCRPIRSISRRRSSPTSAVLLNITPDHLDRHGDMAGYAAVKARIFARQCTGDTAVVGVDEPGAAAIASGAAGGIRPMSAVSVLGRWPTASAPATACSTTAWRRAVAGRPRRRSTRCAARTIGRTPRRLWRRAGAGARRGGDRRGLEQLPGPRPSHGAGRPQRQRHLRQ